MERIGRTLNAAPLLLALAVLATAGGVRADAPTEGGTMRPHYIEIVTRDVEGVCAAYAAVHGVRFGEPDPVLGGARTAALTGGGTLGVRGPLREDEEDTVRPYWLVDDLEAAVQAAENAGATVALPRMELPGHGVIAIVIQGGVQHGFWQE